VGALGLLLIQAARLESRSGSSVGLVVQGAGAPELAAELLRCARETCTESETDGWTEDEMRGHVLLKGFMEDHRLRWNQVLDDESLRESEERSGLQLSTLLWAGLRALATMADSLRNLSGPWQLPRAHAVPGGAGCARCGRRSGGRISRPHGRGPTARTRITHARAALDRKRAGAARRGRARSRCARRAQLCSRRQHAARGGRADREPLGDWPVERYVSAGAEAASAVLHAAGLTELAEEVFAET
jgi:hypothetical protein